LYLNGATSNRIDFAQAGLGDPNVTVRSAGTKIVLYPLVDGSGVDYAIGLTSGVLWNSVHDETRFFKWFANTTPVATLTGTGNFTVTNQLIGYLTGAIGANTANSAAFTTLTASSTTSLNTPTAVSLSAQTIGNSGATIQGDTVKSLNGGQVQGYITGAIGANTPNTGVFTSVTTVSGGQLTGYLTGALGANTPNTVVATSVTTTSGGQLSGYLTGAIGANTANTGVFTSVTTTSGGQVTGYMTGPIGANTANTGVFTTLTATSEYQGAVSGPMNGTLGATTPNSVIATSVTTTNGGQLTGYLTGAIGANSANSAAFTTLTSNGLTTFTNPTQASGYNSASVVLSGGLGVAKDTWIHGNVTIDGNLLVYGARTVIGADTFSVLDPIVDLHTYANLAALTSNDGFDIGLKLHYFDTVDTAAFLGRDNATGYLVWEDKGSDVANVFTPTSVGTFKTGEIWLANTTTATSTITGVLRLDGGAGIKGNVYVGGGINGIIGNGTAAAGTFTTVTTVSGGQLTGYLTGAIGANTANSGVFTTLTATSTTSFNTPTAVSLSAQTIGNSGATIQGDTVKSLNGGQVQGYLTGAIGANTANSGAFTTLTASSTTSFNTPTAVSISAGTIGNSGATIQGDTVKSLNGGQVQGYLTGAIGANTANTGVFTSVTTVSGGQLTGYMTGPIGANTANTGAFTTLTATSTTTLNTPTAVSVSAGTIGNSGATIQGDTVKSLNGGQVQGYLTGAIGANTANTGVFTSVTTTSGGQLTGYLTGAIGANTPNTVVATSMTTVSGGQVTGYMTGAIGANTANTGAFTTITSTSTIVASGNIVANGGIASTNTTTGALVVSGGAGVSGAINAGGGVNLQGNGYLTTDQTTATLVNTVATTVNFAGIATTVNIGSSTGNTTVNNGFVASRSAWINSGGTSANLVVQGNITSGYQNLLVTNGATGQVGIKKAPGSLTPYSSFEINATDSFIVPVGTSGQRPASGQEVKGMTRFNSSTNQFETWDGTQWATGGATFTLISSDNFVGTGAQLPFTLSQSGTTASTLVAINGIIQIPTTAYTVSGTTLTFTEAPLSTDYIDARVLATTTTLSILSDGTSSINVSNTAPAVYATVQNSNVWVANTSTYFSGGISTFNANTSLTQNVLTTVDTFSKTKFRSAKYIVTVSDFANTKYQTAEVLVVHDGTTATATTYGVASTSGSSFVNYGATVSGSNILLQANSTSTASYASVQQIYNPV
jgi:hypothetical protein